MSTNILVHYSSWDSKGISIYWYLFLAKSTVQCKLNYIDYCIQLIYIIQKITINNLSRLTENTK